MSRDGTQPASTTPRRTPIDVLSVILSAFAFGGIVYGLSQFGEAANGSSIPGWVPLAVGFVGLTCFIARQLVLQRRDRALLDLRTFQSRTFTVSILVLAISMMALFGTVILLPIYLQGTYDAVARSGERAEARRQLESLPLRARDAGRAIEVPADDAVALARELELPEGWQVRATAPLRVDANGICHGVPVAVQAPGFAETWTLSTPDCGVRDAQ